MRVYVNEIESWGFSLNHITAMPLWYYAFVHVLTEQVFPFFVLIDGVEPPIHSLKYYCLFRLAILDLRDVLVQKFQYLLDIKMLHASVIFVLRTT